MNRERAWDLEMLSLEIGELGEAGFAQGRTDPDDAPEPSAHPVAEPGDLWVLGRHRLSLRRQHSGDRR
jgi:hypothetical protein